MAFEIYGSRNNTSTSYKDRFIMKMYAQLMDNPYDASKYEKGSREYNLLMNNDYYRKEYGPKPTQVDKRSNSKTLTELAKSENNSDRLAVALSSNTEPEILDFLATDDDWHVREAVAWNNNTSTKTLSKIMLNEKEDKNIRTRAFRNPNASVWDQEKHIGS